MNENLINYASSLNFIKVKIIKINNIIFNKEFRKYCKENVCKNYNASYSCPPHCGSFNALMEKVKKYENALILQTINHIDTSNQELIKQVKKIHNEKTLILKEYLLNKYNTNSLIAGAGQCDLCDKCNLLSKLPCKYPKRRFSSVSAYCVDMSNLALTNDLNYIFTKDSVSMFSIIFF